MPENRAHALPARPASPAPPRRTDAARRARTLAAALLAATALPLTACQDGGGYRAALPRAVSPPRPRPPAPPRARDACTPRCCASTPAPSRTAPATCC
ncbi:hypothetical protein O1L44_15565 [Streptomyces noursei]|nr:hypothetical protein [Streptomyces noursei]